MSPTVEPEDRILLALVAVFAPGRAARLLSRLALPAADPLLDEGVRIAGAPRRARLLALSESLASEGALRADSLNPGTGAPRSIGRSAYHPSSLSAPISSTWRRHGP